MQFLASSLRNWGRQFKFVNLCECVANYITTEVAEHIHV